MKFFSLFGLILVSLVFSTMALGQSAGMETDASPVNINTANEEELAATLKNIGLEKAAAIVRYRDMHGQFKSLDDLLKVSGIGPVTLEMNRGRMTLHGFDGSDQPSVPGRSQDKADVAKHEVYE